MVGLTHAWSYDFRSAALLETDFHFGMLLQRNKISLLHSRFTCIWHAVASLVKLVVEFLSFRGDVLICIQTKILSSTRSPTWPPPGCLPPARPLFIGSIALNALAMHGARSASHTFLSILRLWRCVYLYLMSVYGIYLYGLAFRAHTCIISLDQSAGADHSMQHRMSHRSWLWI